MYEEPKHIVHKYEKVLFATDRISVRIACDSMQGSKFVI